MFKFQIQKKSKKTKARIGEIKTPHGIIKTPAFIPVATLGVLKGGLSPSDVNIQCQIVNSFHFLDLNRVNEVGDLHDFFNFQKPIFTDSGGFQAFSLGKGSEQGLGKISSIFPDKESKNKKGKNLVTTTQMGIKFKSPRDGREIYLTPELSCQIQRKLGADFVYLLDVCGSPLDDKKTAKKEMDLSHKWFERFLKDFKTKKQRAFGIIQGGVFKDLRIESTKFVNNLDVFGIAIGGALGKDKKEMYKIIDWVNEKIDYERPHHLLGIGDLETIEEIVKRGIDFFDCAMPTRIARHGTAMTRNGYLNLTSSKYKKSFEPIEKDCKCPVCQKWTKAQINFLFKAKEPLGGRLLTIHNLWFLERKLESIRKKIIEGEL
jgi:queuine tRNA-ribosyltransferase